MKTFFERFFYFAGNKEDTHLKLVSTSPATHMNFVVKDAGDGRSISLRAAEAIKVRDTLIEAYPLPKAEPEPSEYKVRKGWGRDCFTGRRKDCWEVYREVPSTESKNIAKAATEEDAKKIAQALNEAEGL